ncbi:MAG: hypothetical protein MUF81_03255 [Verrucomicrobia bacterium]|jgi:hypothetical protein|nr:hypothetical protein [Verrucomicrobiota bacterium]
MKTTISIVCALVLGAGVVSAVPDQAGQSKQDSTPGRKANEQVKMTSDRPQKGSRVQRTVNLSGRITDGPYQLVIISNEAIKRSGYAQVSQVLRSQAVRR